MLFLSLVSYIKQTNVEKVANFFASSILAFSNPSKISVELTPIYAAIVSVHFTEPQVLHGGKVSLFERGMLVLSPFSLQK